jgi:hypothetical protein
MCLCVTTASENEKRDMGMKKESIKMMKRIEMKREKEKDDGEDERREMKCEDMKIGLNIEMH